MSYGFSDSRFRIYAKSCLYSDHFDIKTPLWRKLQARSCFWAKSCFCCSRTAANFPRTFETRFGKFMVESTLGIMESCFCFWFSKHTMWDTPFFYCIETVVSQPNKEYISWPDSANLACAMFHFTFTSEHQLIPLYKTETCSWWDSCLTFQRNPPSLTPPCIWQGAIGTNFEWSLLFVSSPGVFKRNITYVTLFQIELLWTAFGAKPQQRCASMSCWRQIKVATHGFF